ncbi:substrate-binding periplasmic protein [Agarivorans sp. QJM3NY_33]|uniref:substrate-binding periplasmic protein n=1 Tax=Agarivorans sp. QJM3NY_33 TaxID=3421432 RepID=UPI003D7CD018
MKFLWRLSLGLWLLLSPYCYANNLKLLILEQPPIEYQQNGYNKGIAVDIVKEVFARLHRPVTIEVYPFARALRMLEESKADGIFAIVKKSERQVYLNYSDEVLIEQAAVLYVQAQSEITFNGQLGDLGAYRFGVLRGATYGPMWEQVIDSGGISKIERVADYRQNVMKLVNQRLDVIIGPDYTMAYIIKELGQEGRLKQLSPHIEVVPTYIAFSKNTVAPELVAAFSDTLKALKRDGTYQRIINRYIE